MNCYYQMFLGTEDDIITKNLEANVDRKLLLNALHQLSDREKQIMELTFWSWKWGRKNTKGCCRYARYFAVLYFSIRKTNH